MSKEVLKKRSVPYRKFEVGMKIEGVYLGSKVNEKEEENRLTGEVETKRVHVLKFHEPGNEDKKFTLMGSAGLRTALESADVLPGEEIIMERLADGKTRDGKQLSQYDIFSRA